MKEVYVERSPLKGLLSGLIAGLAATAAMSVAERLYATQTSSGPVPGSTAEDPFADLGDRRSKGGGLANADWRLGAAAGAAYGLLAEYYPAATSGDGKTFGLALMTLTRDAAPTVERLAQEIQIDAEGAIIQQPSNQLAAAHLVFGTVAEQVRSYVRRFL